MLASSVVFQTLGPEEKFLLCPMTQVAVTWGRALLCHMAQDKEGLGGSFLSPGPRLQSDSSNNELSQLCG